MSNLRHGIRFLRTWLRLLRVCTSPPFPSLQVVILRRNLYALVGRDVMVASFGSVSAVTVGAMSAMVGGVIALMLAGMTQVREQYTQPLDGYKIINTRIGRFRLSLLYNVVVRKAMTVILKGVARFGQDALATIEKPL